MIASMIFYFWAVAFAWVSNEPKEKLLWSDEFSQELDTLKWTVITGSGCPDLCGWGNNEQQVYAHAKENLRIEEGVLVLEAQHAGEGIFSSARISTRGKAHWQYGYIEVKAKLPQGRGTWPAIWMLPEVFQYGNWPHSGEIDIMEHVGYDPGVIHGTVHTGAFNHIKGTQKGKQVQVSSFASEFHVYAVNWLEDRIEFYVDDALYHVFYNTGEGTEDWPFDHPFYLLLNVAVGGNWGGKEGVDSLVFPQRMEIDYVRVYQAREPKS